jgi:hypothetical protein
MNQQQPTTTISSHAAMHKPTPKRHKTDERPHRDNHNSNSGFADQSSLKLAGSDLVS